MSYINFYKMWFLIFFSVMISASDISVPSYEGVVIRLTSSQSDQAIENLMTKMHQYPYLNDVSDGIVQTCLRDDRTGFISGHINTSDIAETLQFMWDIDSGLPIRSMDPLRNVCIVARCASQENFNVQMRSASSTQGLSDEVLIRIIARRR